MRLIILLLTFAALFSPNHGTDEISDCSTHKQVSLRKLINQNDLYIVSTLDGKVTALDLNNNGQILWSYSTNDEGLLHSTIGDFQFISDAIYFKLVPALDGSLYKLNEKYHILEPVPLNADILLKSTFKLGDDLLISGGKEIKTFAFDLISGDLVYSCGMADCTNKNKGSENNSDLNIILIRQLRQKVKAVDPRTGAEQWKFNVGENNAVLLSKADDCHLFDNIDRSTNLDERLKINIAEGLVALENRNEDKLLWSQKFDSPIVGMWQYRGGRMDTVDLFSLDSSYSDSRIKKPFGYIGHHRDQFYILHSTFIKERYPEIDKMHNSLDPRHHLPLIDWEEPKDVTNELQVVPAGSRGLSLATSSGRFLFMKRNTDGQCHPPTIVEGVTTEENNLQVAINPSTAISVSSKREGFPFLNENTDSQAYNSGDDKILNLSLEDYYNETRSPSDSINQIIIISLWHWWKEVLIISVSLAVFFNIAISYIRKKILTKVAASCSSSSSSDQSCLVLAPNHSSSREATPTTNSWPTLKQSQSSNDSAPSENGSYYISRYSTDFEPISCLGKGGFGVVFQARNKIDDCCYAIKRINLPLQQSAREKVMREVRALASLEHQGIVRYYNSWLEIPPEGWQDENDIGFLPDKSSIWSSDPQTPSFKSEPVMRKTSTANFKAVPFDNNYNTEEDDSYIVFQRSTGSEENQEKTQESYKPTSLTTKNTTKPERCPTPSRHAYLYIQMQLCQKETLREWLKKNHEREKGVIFEYFLQIVEAVEYVHSKKLMHRDLKPSNIFFAMDGCVKIGDFGLVTAVAVDFLNNVAGDITTWDTSRTDKCHTDQVGTKLYMSPEQISGANYSNKVDIYSLGVIFFEMLVPFTTEMERIKVLSNIKEGLFPNKFKMLHSEECKLVSKLLSNDPDARPLAEEILEDPIFQEAAKENLIERIPRKRTISASKAH